MAAFGQPCELERLRNPSIMKYLKNSGSRKKNVFLKTQPRRLDSKEIPQSPSPPKKEQKERKWEQKARNVIEC